MVEKVSIGDIGNDLPVIFFGRNDSKVVTFRFDEGPAPDGETLKRGEWLKFFPGETDLAGRNVNEQLRGGVYETFIWDEDQETKAVLSIGELAISAIKRAIIRAGYDMNKPEEWTKLTFIMQRKGDRGWKVEIRDDSEMEEIIKGALEDAVGQTFNGIDDLALKISIEYDLEDIELIKEILLRLKGNYFALGPKGLKLKK